VAGVASSEYGAAQMLLAAVSMGRDGNYTITTNATIGVMAALTVLTGLVNSLSTYWMEKMTKTYVIFHVLVLVSCSIALLVMTKSKHDANYVFTNVDSTSWTMTDYDATAHITEEISEPEIKAPWAISLAMLFTYLAGFLFNIVLCFCMGDPSLILASPLAQPVAQLFFNSLGKGGGIFFTVAGFIIIKFVCFTAMVSFPHPQPSLLLLTFNSKHWAEPSLPFHVIVSFRSTTSGPKSTPRQALLLTLYGSRSFSASPLT
jgi:amino acid transporter